MSIRVIQTGSLTGLTGAGGSGNAFTANVTSKSSILLAFTDFNTTSAVISTSNPTFAGSAVAGAVQLIEQQSALSAGSVYAAIWLLPDVAGGSENIGITCVNGTGGVNVGIIPWEVAGLGSAPTPGASSSGTGYSTTDSSGVAGPITAAPGIVAGVCVGYGQVLPGAGLPWVETTIGASFVYAGYQITTAPGGSYTYAMTGGSTAEWAATVATVKGTSGSGMLMASLP